MSNRAFADKHTRRLIAQAQAGSMLDGKGTIGGDFTWFDLQMTAQRTHHCVGSGVSAYGRTTHAHHSPTHRFAAEHFVEVDDAENFGERDV
jgi:hypothetical protein